MKKSELQKIIREEAKKLMSESSVGDYYIEIGETIESVESGLMKLIELIGKTGDSNISGKLELIKKSLEPIKKKYNQYDYNNSDQNNIGI